VQIRQVALPDQPERPEAPPRAPRSQVLAVTIDLGDQLRLRGRGIDTRLAGTLNLSTSNGRLLLTGIVDGTGGTYQAYGQKLDIERALVIFGGEFDNPNLDILAIRPNLDVVVGVAINGPSASPRVRLYSGSEMSDSERLSWLLLGRAPDGLGGQDAALLQSAALALLAGEGGGPTDALLRNLGLDELSVRQSDTDTHQTVVALGKQLSRHWYVGYERGVNAASGTWQLIYRIAQRFTLRAQSGFDNSLDLIWVWRLGEPGPAPKAAPVAPPSAAAPPVPESAASAPP
jgi:translocation and assembly module TamB